MSIFTNTTYSAPTSNSMPTIKEIIASMDEIKRNYPHKVIVCHPDNLYLLRDFLADIQMEIRPHECCPLRAERWQFPTERFIKYEKKDEVWAIPLGFGKWVDDGPWFAVVDMTKLARMNIANAFELENWQ